MARLSRLIKATAIERVLVSSLKPNPRNTRVHPEKQVALLSKGMREFGFHSPLVIDEDGMILCGHGRFEAAKDLQLDDVPVIRLHGLTPSQKIALAIADNKLASIGEYNLEILGQELAVLYDPEADLSFDPSITGYDTVELDQILVGEDKSPADSANAVDIPSGLEPVVTQLGDVWQCGVHRLLCGDALSNDAYDALMGDERAQVVFVDPPYNVPNSGHVSRRADVREFAMAYGEKSKEEFTSFLSAACNKIRRYAADNAVVYICMDWRHSPELSAATSSIFGEPKNICVWVKSNAGMGKALLS